MKDLNIIVKADVQGSVEAVKQNLEKISNEEVRVKVIHGGVGAINESDIMLASTSNAIVVGFNVRPDAAAKAMRRARPCGYADVPRHLRVHRRNRGRHEGYAGAQVQGSGIGHRGSAQGLQDQQRGHRRRLLCHRGQGHPHPPSCALVRDGIVIHEGEIASLQRFKDSVKEVTSGYECGITLEKFSDIKEGDIFECFEMQEIER